VIALDNLNQRTPIVDSQGQPTREFMIKWQQLKAATGAIPALETAAEVSAVLDIVGSPTPGGLLVRGASEWEPLPIGAADDVLTSISGAPVWAPSGALPATFSCAGRQLGSLFPMAWSATSSPPPGLSQTAWRGIL